MARAVRLLARCTGCNTDAAIVSSLSISCEWVTMIGSSSLLRAILLRVLRFATCTGCSVPREARQLDVIAFDPTGKRHVVESRACLKNGPSVTSPLQIGPKLQAPIN